MNTPVIEQTLEHAIEAMEMIKAKPFTLVGDFTKDGQSLNHFCDLAAPLAQLSTDMKTKAERDQQTQTLLDTGNSVIRQARQQFMATHSAELYEQLCQQLTKNAEAVSLNGLMQAANEILPSLLPTSEQLARDEQFLQVDKQGYEIDQGIFFSGLLANQSVGLDLIEQLQKPSAKALSLVDEFNHSKLLDLGKVRLELKGHAGHITFQNPDCLNAEDNELIAQLEVAVDLVLLSDLVKVGVLRGGVVNNKKYAGKRVFSAGINLKHLHRGQISLVDFLLARELGYINKMMRGLATDNLIKGVNFNRVEKPWLAVVDTFAIGGGMQLLLACDYVVGESGSYANLPAAKEGIVPGVGNLRLATKTNHTIATQVILHGRSIFADEPDARLLFDQVVTSDELDEATDKAIEVLSPPAVVANRRMLNLSKEPVEIFRQYMAQFALEQSVRMNSEDVHAIVGQFNPGNAKG